MMSDNDLEYIGQCFLNDIDLEKRDSTNPELKSQVSKLVQLFSSHSLSTKVVYTAFDGDHFHLLQHMRRYVFLNNCFPANPESILNYRNVVMRHQSKYGVLLDDLAILQKCDELWIFSENGHSLNEILKLPEGVLVEIAYFLKRRHEAQISIIPISGLIKDINNVEKKKVEITFENLEKILVENEMKQILDIANSNFKVDKELRNLVYFISDPLDFKYSEWLRDRNNLGGDEVALVPGLASKIFDLEPSLINIGRIVLSWATLLNKLSKKRAYYLKNFDHRREDSVISESLKNYCIQIKGSNYLREKDWDSYSIPKRIQKERWPITTYESKQLSKRY